MSNEEEQSKEFLRIYEKYIDELFRYSFFKTGNKEQSTELVQEVYMKTWKTMQNGQTLGNSRAFLYTLLRNAITDWYRKNKPVSLDALQEEGFDFPQAEEGNAFDNLEAARILETSSKLEEKYREVIVLRFVNDLTVSEIAQVLGEKENNVSVRIHRALEKLKKLYLKK
jgi:RNA polymerase sigma-70 factor (ECF subfamily)